MPFFLRCDLTGKTLQISPPAWTRGTVKRFALAGRDRATRQAAAAGRMTLSFTCSGAGNS
jgi:hypothetical protein